MLMRGEGCGATVKKMFKVAPRAKLVTNLRRGVPFPSLLLVRGLGFSLGLLRVLVRLRRFCVVG